MVCILNSTYTCTYISLKKQICCPKGAIKKPIDPNIRVCEEDEVYDYYDCAEEEECVCDALPASMNPPTKYVYNNKDVCGSKGEY